MLKAKKVKLENVKVWSSALKIPRQKMKRIIFLEDRTFWSQCGICWNWEERSVGRAFDTKWPLDNCNNRKWWKKGKAPRKDYKNQVVEDTGIKTRGVWWRKMERNTSRSSFNRSYDSKNKNSRSLYV